MTDAWMEKIEDYLVEEGYRALEKALFEMSPEDVIAEMKHSRWAQSPLRFPNRVLSHPASAFPSRLLSLRKCSRRRSKCRSFSFAARRMTFLFPLQ